MKRRNLLLRKKDKVDVQARKMFDRYREKMRRETVADILQRKAAKYGDSSGTRTWKRRDSAEKKVNSYYARLGRLV